MIRNTKYGLKVQLRGGFSDRNNINPVNKTLQYEDFDNRTRIACVNLINKFYHDTFTVSIPGYVEYFDHQKANFFWNKILTDVYIQPIDYAGPNQNEMGMLRMVKDTVTEDSYDAVLTLIEFICNYFSEVKNTNNVFESFNVLFEKECVGYRFINGIIVKITDPVEISAIEETTQNITDPINEHINKALVLMSNQKNPDYENSIKESISAVEAMCNRILGIEGSLGAALKRLSDNGIDIHPALKQAFEKLYGYTSDASGIRHAGKLDGPKSTFEEAKYMVVACSAFVNYLNGLESKRC